MRPGVVAGSFKKRPPASSGRPFGPFLLMILAVAIAMGGAFLFLELPFELSAAAALGLVPGLLVAIFIMRRPFAGLLLIYFFMYVRPQDIITSLRPLHLPLLLTFGVFGIYVINVIRDSQKRVYWSGPMTTYAALIVFMVINVFTSINNRHAFDFFRGTTQTIIFAFLTTTLVSNVKDMSKLLRLWIIWHVYLCCKGIMQFAAGTLDGTTGSVGSNFLGDENDFALALVVVFPFLFFSIQKSKSPREKLIWTILTGMVLTTIMLTMSRGGFLGIAVTLIFCWLMSPNKLRNLVVMAFLVIFVAVLAPPQYYEEIASIKNTDEGTANLRKEYWMSGIRMFAEYPLVGVGQGNSPIYMADYINLPNANTKWGRAMHGTIPLLLAELGVIGFILFATLFIQSFRRVYYMVRIPIRDPDTREFIEYMSLSCSASMIGFVVASTFLSALYYPHIYLLSAFCIVGYKLALMAHDQEEEGEEKPA